MSWRFQRRIRLLPGLRLNFSKSGVSASIGHRRAWLTVGPRRRRATIGWPGSGLFFTQTYPPAQRRATIGWPSAGLRARHRRRAEVR
jgi:hypothetical protein